MTKAQGVNLADVAEQLQIADDALRNVVGMMTVVTEDGRTTTLLGVLTNDARELVRTLAMITDASIRALPERGWPLYELDETP